MDRGMKKREGGRALERRVKNGARGGGEREGKSSGETDANMKSISIVPEAFRIENQSCWAIFYACKFKEHIRTRFLSRRDQTPNMHEVQANVWMRADPISVHSQASKTLWMTAGARRISLESSDKRNNEQGSDQFLYPSLVSPKGLWNIFYRGSVYSLDRRIYMANVILRLTFFTIRLHLLTII